VAAAGAVDVKKGFQRRAGVVSGGSIPVEWLNSKPEQKRLELAVRAKQAREQLGFKLQEQEGGAGEVVGVGEGRGELLGDGYAMDFPSALKAAAAAEDAAAGGAGDTHMKDGGSDKQVPTPPSPAAAADADGSRQEPAAAGKERRGFTLEVQRESPKASPGVSPRSPSDNFRDFVRRQRGGVRRVVAKDQRHSRYTATEKLAWEAVRKEMDALGTGSSSSSNKHRSSSSPAAAAAADSADDADELTKDLDGSSAAAAAEGGVDGVEGRVKDTTATSRRSWRRARGGAAAASGAEVLEAAAAGDVSLAAAEPFMGWVRESLDVAGVEDQDLEQMVLGAAARLDEEMMEEWGKWTYRKNFKP
jgi:hypothetical protein